MIYDTPGPRRNAIVDQERIEPWSHHALRWYGEGPYALGVPAYRATSA